jgi:hypothetical protein
VTRCDAERRAARHQDNACIVLSPDSADKCEVIDAQPGVAAFSCHARRARWVQASRSDAASPTGMPSPGTNRQLFISSADPQLAST